MLLREASSSNVSYVDYSSSAASTGGLEDSALSSSLAALIRNCRLQYVIPAQPVFSEDPKQVGDDGPVR